jgi:transposase, IS30 family
MQKKHSHLGHALRCQIYALKKRDLSQHAIARELGIDQSTVSRELKRNSGKRGYRYKQADRKARNRRANVYVKRTKKLSGFALRFVISKLKEKWSPEQISGSLKKDHKIKLCHEMIYRYVYQNKRSGGGLYKHLRRKGKKYQKRGSRKYAGRGYIKDRVDISERPKIVEKKKRFGDFEADLIEGTKKGKAVLLTLVDRKTQFLLIEKCPSKNASEVRKAMIKSLKPYKGRIYTITSDNGKEFSEHALVAQKLGVRYFFAKPYAAWQRGLNENTNGLVRGYYPKGTNFAKVDVKEIRRVTKNINNRPRKKLNYTKPLELV